MTQHVSILGTLYLLFGILGLVGALVLLVMVGGLAAIAGFSAGEDAAVAVPVLSTVAGGLFLITSLMALPSFVVGLGLLKRRSWARVAGLVLSVLNLPSFPIGTALGIYGVWVLASEQARTSLG